MNDQILEKNPVHPSPALKYLTARSNFGLYGTLDLFIDQRNPDLAELSPEVMTAKLVADFEYLVAGQEAAVRAEIFRTRNKIIPPLRDLVVPLISGSTPYAASASTPDGMFHSMLERTGEAPREGTNRSRQISEGYGDVTPGKLAVFLVLSIILDGADLRQAVGTNVKLHMPHLFRCLCHVLISGLPSPVADGHVGSGQEVSRTATFSRILRQLHEDEFSRSDAGFDILADCH